MKSFVSFEVIKKDPFRIFFPLGVLVGIFGSMLWPLAAWRPAVFGYPTEVHRILMIAGFLLAFVIGFLMTAVPRFTKTSTASGVELISAVLLLVLSLGAFLFFGITVFLSGTFLSVLALVRFGSLRFVKRKDNPPSTFVFVGVGILLLGVSSVLSIFSWSVQTDLLVKNLFSQASVLCLIVGVGSRLLPGIFGWTEIVSAQRKIYERPIPFLKAVPKALFACVVVLIASFFVEAFYMNNLGQWIRAVLISGIAAYYWKLYRFPINRNFLTAFLWISGWFVLLGIVLNALGVLSHADSLHLLFIGGFSLMTLMIASRVTIAHCGESPLLNENSIILLLVGVLIFLSAVGRTLSTFSPAGYLPSLGAFGLAWSVALVIWGVVFIPAMLLTNKDSHND